EVEAPHRLLRPAQPETEETQQVRLPGGQVPDARVDAGRVHAHEDLAATGRRSFDVAELEDVRAAVAVLDDGFHGHSSGYWNTSSSGTPNTCAIWNAISSDGE